MMRLRPVEHDRLAASSQIVRHMIAMTQAVLSSERWSVFVWRVVACHMTSYFVIGWFASTLLGYRELFGSAASPPTGSWQYMRGFDSPWVAAGPVLQVVRGALFGIVLWPVRSIWVSEQSGILRVWLLLVGLALLGPTAAAPGSLEGMIYTNLPMTSHLLGWPEMGIQTLLFCLLVQRWYRQPNRWWNRTMIVLLILVCCSCTLGVLAALYPEAFRR